MKGLPYDNSPYDNPKNPHRYIQGAGRFAAVPQGIRDDLAGASTLGQPDPAFVLTRKDVGPHFVQLEHVALFSVDQRLLELGQSRGFFLAR